MKDAEIGMGGVFEVGCRIEENADEVWETVSIWCHFQGRLIFVAKDGTSCRLIGPYCAGSFQ